MATPTISGLRGTGYKAIQSPTLNPAQQNAFNQLLPQASQGLQGALGQLSQQASGGSPEYWQQLEAPAFRQFGELQGNLASRFSGMGSGARHSSGFQNALTGASTDLAERLQSQRLGLQGSAQQMLQQLVENLLGQRTFETGFIPKKRPAWQELLLGLGGSAGNALGSLGGFGLGKFANLI